MQSLTSYIMEAGRRKKQQEEMAIEGMSTLDKFNKADEREKEKLLIKQFKEVIKQNGPTIYAFVVKEIKNCIKIGYTDQHPAKRIAQWKDIYEKEHGYELTPIGIWTADEFDEAAKERVFFWDHAVHKKVMDKKYLRVEKDDFYTRIDDKSDKDLTTVHYSREFFNKYKTLLDGDVDPEEAVELSKELIEDIIGEMKKNIKAGTADFEVYSYDTHEKAKEVWGSPDSYNNTDLQDDAIQNGVNAIKAGKTNLLMAAVMRFGKTHACYEIVKKARLKNVIVTSAKAETRKAWREDINHKHFYKNFIFVEIFRDDKWTVTAYDPEKKTLVTDRYNVYENMLEDKWPGTTKIFYFTLHDLAGSLEEMKKKHVGVIDQEFDLMIVDETHYGSHSAKFGKMTGYVKEYVDDDYEDEVADMKEEQEEMERDMKELDAIKGSTGLKYKRALQVSGTPYYILASNEMIEDGAEIISKVSYTDMLNARDKWDDENSKKPEDEQQDPWKSPYYGMPTLHKVGMKLTKGCREILKKKGISGDISGLFQLKNGKFIYEKQVKELMQSLFGDGSDTKMAFLENKKVEGTKTCKHTMIVLPRIAACEAMKKLLKTFIDEKKRVIINLTGGNPDAVVSGDGKGKPVLDKYLIELDEQEKKSIILTVNKALTGVSLKALDSMIYLKNAKSPQEYDQNIFRLCTRYVKKMKSKDGKNTKFVNMKDNVYLIDFNIANMFNMLANSARMKAAAEGNPTTERIKELMDEDLGTVPVFCEDGTRNEIMAKMNKISSKDLMLIYSGYNKNKSIADIAGDEVDMFMKLFEKPSFQSKMNAMFKEGDKSKINIEQPDEETGEVDMTGVPDAEKKDKEMKHLSDKARDITAGEIKKQAKEAREKFKKLVKLLLYWNLCQDTPYQDMESIMKAVDENKELEKEFNSFGIKYDNMVELYKGMGTNFKMAFNQILTNINILSKDKSRGSKEKFLKALEGLGRIEKSEVITPEPVVEKMINKISDEEYESAKTILLVNEKSAEFFRGLCKKFNNKNSIIEKCRIVPSSEIGTMFVKKMLKTMGLLEYINTIILDIGDVDENGQYDVKDFLKLMEKKEVEKKTGIKKFDICLMNPPYNLANKFLEKILQVSNKVVTIQPSNWLFGVIKKKKIIEQIENSYINIERIKDDVGFDAGFGNELSIDYFNLLEKYSLIIDNENVTENIYNITHYSTDKLICEFNNKIKPLYTKDNIKNHILEYELKQYVDDNHWCVKIPEIRGHRAKKGVNPDFYTILSNNDNFTKQHIIGEFKNIQGVTKKSDLKYYIDLITKEAANNILNYLKTDFVRGLLFISKMNFAVANGPTLRYIPWFDFSQDIFSKSPKEIDDYLFKKYDISDEIRKHIEEILPDYYNIRK